ncbi:Eco57I restriction-modification methylase domain-containing protein [Propionispora vibrioides]|jgi:adenine-specific DNA-methyltransferase|uniref:site-specific DNA-methyltransferase (adenine-specific) n=1 Tax=Propionispora vibrioides TaxID=112903 RepID=A0A1H8WVW7_9FIRM|nr:N-6 DNA methylase [Propionispora vibrioides]SEP31749.1 N-6 DNA Methylase [Propionispora vibrioides]
MSVNTKCQVFTPNRNVQELLDYIGYTQGLYGKKVAENSCGDGSILVEIVKRYIIDSMDKKVSVDKIKKGLEKDIWAAEIDIAHIINCKAKLDEIAGEYGLVDVEWNIFHGDFLKQKITNKFDFVVGNPPYITYKEIDPSNRVFVRENFETCVIGKFDYCYAFIEASIKSLKKTGKLAYLIPSNIFKNQFASNLRNYILPYLTDIYDYKNQKLFAGKLTASAIIICDLDNSSKSITYHNLSEDKKYILNKELLEGKWVLKENIANPEGVEFVRFGDYFHAASSVATLLNKVYIISDFIEGDNYITVKGQQIEKELLREAVSPRSLNYEKKEYIIFPYYYTKEGLQKYSDVEFRKKFPCAVRYLLQFKKILSERNNDEGINWFEYGRVQALAHLNQKKILISTLITGHVKVTLLNELVIPTSGLYIVPKNNQPIYDLSTAVNILRSDLFLEYAKNVGVISNGKSFRISPKDVNNFTFPVSLLK